MLKFIKDLLGIKPVQIGKLNEQATYSPKQKKDSKPNRSDRLDNLGDIQEIPEYKQIKALIDAGASFIFVTGGAGTGKSTLIEYLKRSLRLRMAVCAPTGVAALNIKGVTLHSLFRLPPRIIQAHDIRPPKDRGLYTKMELLIIDEISMVRPDILDGINLFLQQIRKNKNPFGGVKVLCIGDLYQLPPVVTYNDGPVLKNMGYESEYFFSAHCFQEISLIPVILTHIFRQKEKQFTDLLNNIREGQEIPNTLGTLNNFANKPYVKQDDHLCLVCTNKKADNINAKELAQLPSREISFKGKITGKFDIGRDILPSPIDLTLKTDAKVMFTKNDDTKKWVNGSLGKVVFIKDNCVKVQLVDVPGKPVYEVEPVTWEKYRYEYDREKDKIVAKVIGTYTQLPLMLAWAVTIHKSQGKTLPHVYIDLGNNAFANGQVYVALSRVRQLDHIQLARPIHVKDVKCDVRINRFYSALIDLAKVDEPHSVSQPEPGWGSQKQLTGDTQQSELKRDVEVEESPFSAPQKLLAVFKEPGEREVIQEHGTRVNALIKGEREPADDEEKHLVNVVLKKEAPMNDFEKIWKRYFAREKWLADPKNQKAGDEKPRIGDDPIGSRESFKKMRNWRLG
ncbi:DUF413 domain-containing protein [Fibrobacterota bacterium]